ncbi:TrkH family potassium uptake protein [Desulfosarcina sp. OttesenSCG-928-A07]|nr:TrkH family potassium uptake protein [Desulfosarcina sp. OttesenSCG-928-G17]MDL2329134.1 TrkH family potassium uptake protein [Desulfosarcina sp. OttesenSCG-928-A07]
MRWPNIFHTVGVLLLFFGLTMLAPLIFSLATVDMKGLVPMLEAMGVTLVTGGLLMFFFRHDKTDIITQREGMAIVGIGWAAIGLFGAFPFYFSDPTLSFTDAAFESISGFTTTGATILTDIEALRPCLVFWRGFIQWLGGMGIIVLSIAILPFLGIDGIHMYKAEIPTPMPEKLKPHLRDTALILWKVYLSFTVIETVLLMVCGMSPFDALNQALTTMSTGGNSTRNASIAHFDNAAIDWIIVLFMVLGGINFALHYQLIKGDPLVFWKDAECRVFMALWIVLSLFVGMNLYGTIYPDILNSLRYGTFQVVSIITSTGYVTADYEKWPALSQVILFFCMFVGASAGSTSGGIKCLRIMVCFKYCYKELFSIMHPRSVTHIKIGGKTVPDTVVRNVLGFLALYILLFVINSLILAGIGEVDMLTAISAVASAMGNIGPGFGTVGPLDNYAEISAMGKWLLSWCMLLGRLEIYTLIILVVPEFWRK